VCITTSPFVSQSLNELLETADAPVEVIEGFIQTISLTVPWAALLQENCALEVRGLEMVFRPRPRMGKERLHMQCYIPITNYLLQLELIPCLLWSRYWSGTHVLVQFHDKQYAACQRVSESEVDG